MTEGDGVRMEFDEVGHLRRRIVARCLDLLIAPHERFRLEQPGFGHSTRSEETHVRVLDEMLTLLVEVFPCRAGLDWLRQPNAAFSWRTPLELAQHGPSGLRGVRDHLRILHEASID